MKELKIHLGNHTGENPVINFGKVRSYNTSNQLNISNYNFVSKTYIVQTAINHCIEKISLKLCVVSQRGDNNMTKQTFICLGTKSFFEYLKNIFLSVWKSEYKYESNILAPYNRVCRFIVQSVIVYITCVLKVYCSTLAIL